MIIHRETEAQSPTATPKKSPEPNGAPTDTPACNRAPTASKQTRLLYLHSWTGKKEQEKGQCWRSRWLWSFPKDPWELLHFLGAGGCNSCFP